MNNNSNKKQIISQSRVDTQLIDAIRSFKSFYGINYFKFGKQIAYTPDGKVSETISRGLNNDDIETHLTLGNTAATLAYGIGRVGLISSDENQAYGIIGSIDIDKHDLESEQIFNAICESIENFCKIYQLIYYKELTLSEGYHYNFPFEEPVQLSKIVNFLYYITYSIQQPSLETYPMGKDPSNGRWMYVGHSGALSEIYDETGKFIVKDQKKNKETIYKFGYGRTFQVDSTGKAINIFELETVKKNSIQKIIDMADVGQDIKDKIAETFKQNPANDNPMVQDISDDGFNFQEICKCITDKIPHNDGNIPNIKFMRHDSLFCWLNVGRRMNRLDDVSNVLKEQSTYEAWITDGSRTLTAWESEIDRICEKFKHYGTEDYGYEYGIKRLLAMGWRVPDLAKLAPEIVLANTKQPKISNQAKEKFGKQSDRTLARRLIERAKNDELPYLYREKKKSIYQYNGEFYQLVKDYRLRNIISLWIDSTFGEGIAASIKVIRIIEEMKILLSDERADIESDDIVNTTSGLLHFTKKYGGKYEIKLIKHTSEYITYGKIHATYNEEYSRKNEWDACRLILALRTSFYSLTDEEAINSITTIMEFIGYSFTGFTQAQKALNLHGEAGTGKSMIMDVIQKLGIGIKKQDEVAKEIDYTDSIFSAMFFNQFASSHGLTQIEDKRVVYISEIDSSVSGRQSMINLKSIIGGDKISINPKNINAYTYQSLCKVVIASNTELAFGSDRANDSITRRLVRVHFPARLREADKNNSIREYITESQEQLDRIFSIAIKSGLTFINNNWQNTKYDHDEAIIDAKEEMNPIIDFIRQYVVPAKEYEKDHDLPSAVRLRAYIKVSLLARMYTNQLREYSIKPPNPKQFKSGLMDAIATLRWDTKYEVSLLKTKRLNIYLKGVYVKSESDIKEFAQEEYDEVMEQYKTSITTAKLKTY